MQVVELAGIRRFRSATRASRPLALDEVRIQLRAVGVCGSDLHYWREGRIGPQVVDFPLVIGHECAGSIVAIGAAVRRVAVGDRVAVEPGIPCLTCAYCRRGDLHLCLNMRFLGAPPVDGAYAEELAMPEMCVEPIPPEMSFAAAAMLEPFGCSLHCANLVGVQPGDSVGIYGAGPIGVTVAMASRLRGAAHIWLCDPVPARVEWARRFGFQALEVIGDGSNVVQAMLQASEGLGFDRTVDCSGDPQAMRNAMLSCRRGGTVGLQGIPEGTDTVAIPIHELRRREITLKNIRRCNVPLKRLIEIAAAGHVDLDRLVTHRFNLTALPQAFDLVDRKADGVLKALIEDNRP